MSRKVGTSWAITLAAALGLTNPGCAQMVSGQAKALDGDSLEIAGRQVRLFGIDAPEADQTCQKESGPWACGQAAKSQLAALVEGQEVRCQGQGADEYARILAVCSVGYYELNRVMVEQGWAIAFRRFSDAYVGAELEAKTYAKGIWGSTFVSPSDYRQAKRSPEARIADVPASQPRQRSQTFFSSSGSCAIKGNHSRRGEWIYHLPGMPYYEQTRPEAIFCTEQEAIEAGYRRSRAGS